MFSLLPSRALSVKLRARGLRSISTRQFTVQDVPRKGKGAILTQPVKEFDVVLAEPPLVTVQGSEHSVSLSGLSASQMHEYYSLSNCHNDVPVEVGILLTNAFPGPGPEERSVFPLTSRFNHSCRPTAHAAFNPMMWMMEVRATCDGSIGDELSITYMDVVAPTEERQAALMARWNFMCECDVCTLPTKAREKSDERRSIIRAVFESEDYTAWCKSETDPPSLPILTASQMIKAEGLNVEAYSLKHRIHRKLGVINSAEYAPI